jgi:hypothetical protein
MSNYTLYKLTSGKIAIVAPFHATLVAECRRRMGKWSAINTPSGAGYAWTLDAAHRDAIVALAAELFPSREQLIERVVTWTCDGQSASSPTMDGYDVAVFALRWMPAASVTSLLRESLADPHAGVRNSSLQAVLYQIEAGASGEPYQGIVRACAENDPVSDLRTRCASALSALANK